MDDLPPSVAERLARLAPDQRAAATAPPGPVLCVAPAGSGKTTTLVARVAWLLATGADPGSVCVVAFNRRAAEDLRERLDAALAPLGAAGSVRVRTFHGLGRELLAEAGRPTDLADRDEILRDLLPAAPAAERGRADLAISRLKLDLGLRPGEAAAHPAAGAVARLYAAYEARLRAAGALDFDDLVVHALDLLRADAAVLATWRARCAHLLVDEAQDLDRTQLDLALLLAGPARRVFLVGDDDQTVYGWRLADVRRILGLAARLPGLRRVDLEVNYRCPAPVVARAVRLVEHNGERFAKGIRAGPRAAGRLVLAPDAAGDDERVGRLLGTWPDDGTPRAILARTNRELLPAALAAVEAGRPFRAPELRTPLDDPRLDGLLAEAGRLAAAEPGAPLPVILGRLRASLAREAGGGDPDRPGPADLAGALLGWAAPWPTPEALRAALAARRRAFDALRRDDAALVLATAHGTKGLEWDDVAVLADGFPGRRAVADAAEPARALEEERRLAYVAWTRARRSLVLVYDPAAPSPFLLEAFDPDELGLDGVA